MKSLLLTLIVTAVAGATWLVDEGSAAAVVLPHYHIRATRGMIVLFVLHIMAASPHLLEFIWG